jgi:hypothetical protein
VTVANDVASLPGKGFGVLFSSTVNGFAQTVANALAQNQDYASGTSYAPDHCYPADYCVLLYAIKTYDDLKTTSM